MTDGVPPLFWEAFAAHALLAKTTVTVFPRVVDAVDSREAEPDIGKIAAGGAAVRESLLSCPLVSLILKTAVTVHAYRPKLVPFLRLSL
jgi:hypothetical protein